MRITLLPKTRAGKWSVGLSIAYIILIWLKIQYGIPVISFAIAALGIGGFLISLVAELVHYYRGCGFNGVCITDHFLNGNAIVSQDLPWTERIDLFCLGYENACKEGKKIGIDVFFGWEYTYKGTDLLTYCKLICTCLRKTACLETVL